MFFLNLSGLELMTLFSVVSGLVVTLYLLDRSRRRQTVATLRFWKSTRAPESTDRRRRIQQPLSLLLQVISLGLLLLAIAQPRWGTADSRSRDHVVLLDTSSAMAGRNGNATLGEQAQLAAKAYLESLPRTDRVMIVRCDALATPATAFESDHQRLWEAIENSRPASTALQLEQALAFAQQVQRQAGEQPGEIVYIGAGRIAGDSPGAVPANLRVLPIRAAGANVGLRRITARRSAQGEAWQIYAVAHNYGSAAVNAPVGLRFGSAPMAQRLLTVPPGQDQEATFEIRTKAAGLLDISLLQDDAIPSDNNATLELPAVGELSVAVYSPRADSWQPLFAGNPHLKASFYSPAQYPAAGAPQVVIFDRFQPKSMPAAAGIVLVEPPRDSSLIPVRRVVTDTPLTLWRNDVRLGAGLRSKNVQLANTEIFAPAAGDIVVAESKEGPVIVAREGKSRLVAIGFHPQESEMKFELATPLLFANILGWMAPDSFRDWNLEAGAVGTTSVRLDRPAGSDVQVVTDDGRALPFTADGSAIRFFTAAPGIVRVRQGGRETSYSLSLPEVADSGWTLPANVRQGLPRFRGALSPPADWWPWLAGLGLAGLILEWVLYGRQRMRAAGRVIPVSIKDRFRLRRAS